MQMAKKKSKPAADWPELMKAIRDRLDLTQAEAAARIQISQSQWSSFESGKRNPTRPIAHLIRLLDDGTI